MANQYFPYDPRSQTLADWDANRIETLHPTKVDPRYGEMKWNQSIGGYQPTGRQVPQPTPAFGGGSPWASSGGYQQTGRQVPQPTPAFGGGSPWASSGIPAGWHGPSTAGGFVTYARPKGQGEPLGGGGPTYQPTPAFGGGSPWASSGMPAGWHDPRTAGGPTYQIAPGFGSDHGFNGGSFNPIHIGPSGMSRPDSQQQPSAMPQGQASQPQYSAAAGYSQPLMNTGGAPYWNPGGIQNQGNPNQQPNAYTGYPNVQTYSGGLGSVFNGPVTPPNGQSAVSPVVQRPKKTQWPQRPQDQYAGYRQASQGAQGPPSSQANIYTTGGASVPPPPMTEGPEKLAWLQQYGQAWGAQQGGQKPTEQAPAQSPADLYQSRNQPGYTANANPAPGWNPQPGKTGSPSSVPANNAPSPIPPNPATNNAYSYNNPQYSPSPSQPSRTPTPPTPQYTTSQTSTSGLRPGANAPFSPTQQTQGQPNVQTSFQPTNVYGNSQVRQAQNASAANAVPAMTDLRQAAGRPGISLGSGALRGGMGAAAGQMGAQSAAQTAGLGAQMGWQNAGNLLAGQQQRDQEALGWAGLGNAGLSNQLGYQNQYQGNLLGFLGNAYQRL